VTELAKQKWYEAGLAFECTQCGACCSGAEGYVWVEQAEIDAMAELMGMDIAQFERKFVRRVGIKKSLVEYPDGDCVFLDPSTRKCSVYQARPIQCRTWPFWDSNLKSERTWQATCEVCPGSGQGRVYSLEEIELRRKEKKV
jgi:Fe-S-cluster containining protein